MRSISDNNINSITLIQPETLNNKESETKKAGINRHIFKAEYSKYGTDLLQRNSVVSLIGTSLKTKQAFSKKSMKPVFFKKKSANDMTQENREKLALNAKIAAFPYHQNLDKLAINGKKNEPWELACPLVMNAGKEVSLSTKGSKGFMYDQKTGLTAYILHNPKLKKIMLVFGGTTSGKYSGGIIRRLLFNGIFIFSQMISNLQSVVLNKIPKSYRQAKALTTIVKERIDLDPLYKGCILTLSGHSKGAGESVYAALSQKTPLPALCFSSLQINSTICDDISEANKEKACECISHYSIKGDPIPKINKVINHLKHLGELTIIPSKSVLNSPIDRHDKFYNHISHFAEL